MKKYLILVGLILSFGVRADFQTNSTDGEVEYKVYDETIVNLGKGKVGFTESTSRKKQYDLDKNIIRTFEVKYDCKSHKDNTTGYRAPDTIGRAGGDYACEIINADGKGIVDAPIVEPATYEAPNGKTTWVKYNVYNMRLTATDAPCYNPDFLKLGYQYSMFSAIPLAKLKNVADAFATDPQYATTVIGCWSPASHSFIAIRKHDKKILTDENFHIDSTWTKLEKPY
jgi:hypothetical protein